MAVRSPPIQSTLYGSLSHSPRSADQFRLRFSEMVAQLAANRQIRSSRTTTRSYLATILLRRFRHQQPDHPELVRWTDRNDDVYAGSNAGTCPIAVTSSAVLLIRTGARAGACSAAISR